jgi:hypothetical protein
MAHLEIRQRSALFEEEAICGLFGERKGNYHCKISTKKGKSGGWKFKLLDR